VRWDKDSLTEQQREKKNNNNNADKKNIPSAIFSLPDAQLAPEQQLPSLGQLPNLDTEHDTTWY